MTGDTQILPAVEAYAENIAKNTSLFGTVGHTPDLLLSAGDLADAAVADTYSVTGRSIANLISNTGSWSPKIRRNAAVQLGVNKASVTTTQRDQLHAAANNTAVPEATGGPFGNPYAGENAYQAIAEIKSPGSPVTRRFSVPGHKWDKQGRECTSPDPVRAPEVMCCLLVCPKN